MFEAAFEGRMEENPTLIITNLHLSREENMKLFDGKDIVFEKHACVCVVGVRLASYSNYSTSDHDYRGHSATWRHFKGRPTE